MNDETLAEMHARHAREIAAIERGGCWRCGNAEQPGYLLLAGKGGTLVPCPYCRPGKAAEWMADNAPAPASEARCEECGEPLSKHDEGNRLLDGTIKRWCPSGGAREGTDG